MIAAMPDNNEIKTLREMDELSMRIKPLGREADIETVPRDVLLSAHVACPH